MSKSCAASGSSSLISNPKLLYNFPDWGDGMGESNKVIDVLLGEFSGEYVERLYVEVEAEEEEPDFRVDVGVLLFPVFTGTNLCDGLEVE